MGKRNFPVRAAGLLLAVLTFFIPVLAGSSTLARPVKADAAMEDVDIQLVGATAFAEARKSAMAGDDEEMARFVYNTSQIVTFTQWQNFGILIGGRDYLSGSAMNAWQTPISISDGEIETWNDYPQWGASDLAGGYAKYKAFGTAVHNLMNDIVELFPSPDKKPCNGINMKTNEIFEANYDFSKAKSAYVFKTIVDPFIGKYSLIKVSSGVIKSDDTL